MESLARGRRRSVLLVAAGAVILACAIVVLVLAVVSRAARQGAHESWQDAATPSEVFAGGLWVNPNSLPAEEAGGLRKSGRSSAASAVGQIAGQPIAVWLTGSTSRTELVALLKRDLAAAEKTRKTPVFVAYAIPDRDCGNYSSGGYADDASYLAWNRTIATTLRGHHAVVLIEPDSIAMLGRASCTSITKNRLTTLKSVVGAYADDHVDVYLDGGNSHWQKPQVMAERLREAGVARARGFFTNVSNFYGVDTERAYADRLSSLLGGKHFVIDVSRDGAGWKGTWCNPKGAALGQNPHVAKGDTPLDALLWVKTPGASDGTCNGGPAAGRWFESYALALVANRPSG